MCSDGLMVLYVFCYANLDSAWNYNCSLARFQSLCFASPSFIHLTQPFPRTSVFLPLQERHHITFHIFIVSFDPIKLIRRHDAFVQERDLDGNLSEAFKGEVVAVEVVAGLSR